MKKTLLTVLTVILTGCGIGENLGRSCGGTFGDLCTIIFGQNSRDIDTNNYSIEELKKRILALETEFELTVLNVENLYNDTNANQTDINILQAMAANLQVQLTQLQGYENIVDLVDPCGPHAGYDEVLLKTSSGKFIAYFEVGGKRFLSVLLENVTYQTTDTQSCVFYIQNQNIQYP